MKLRDCGFGQRRNKKINFMQIYSGTRLSSAIHRRPLSRFFPEGGGDVCTQARRAFTRWKENKNVGTEPFFIGSVPKGVHSRLWTFLGTERIQLERVKYRLHVEFCRSRSSFYPGRSNFFGRVNGPVHFPCSKLVNHGFLRTAWICGNWYSHKITSLLTNRLFFILS